MREFVLYVLCIAVKIEKREEKVRSRFRRRKEADKVQGRPTQPHKSKKTIKVIVYLI